MRSVRRRCPKEVQIGLEGGRCAGRGRGRGRGEGEQPEGEPASYGIGGAYVGRGVARERARHLLRIRRALSLPRPALLPSACHVLRCVAPAVRGCGGARLRRCAAGSVRGCCGVMQQNAAQHGTLRSVHTQSPPSRAGPLLCAVYCVPRAAYCVQCFAHCVIMLCTAYRDLVLRTAYKYRILRTP